MSKRVSDRNNTFNNTFNNTSISEKERKRLMRVAKKQRLISRNYENVKNYKTNTVKYTGYITEKVSVDWIKVCIGSYKCFYNPHTKAVLWANDQAPPPAIKMVIVSTAEVANIGLAAKVVTRYNVSETKKT